MILCAGCSVNYPHEHRCHGGSCDCRECDNVNRLLDQAEATLAAIAKLPDNLRSILDPLHTVRNTTLETVANTIEALIKGGSK